MPKKTQPREEYREVQAIERAAAVIAQSRKRLDPGQVPLDTHFLWTGQVLNELAELLQERLDIASGVRPNPLFAPKYGRIVAKAKQKAANGSGRPAKRAVVARARASD